MVEHLPRIQDPEFDLQYLRERKKGGNEGRRRKRKERGENKRRKEGQRVNWRWGKTTGLC